MSKIGGKAAHYLTQKPWTPWNPRNQERIWKSEQAEKDRARKESERSELIRKQADLEEQSRLVQALGGDAVAIRESAAHPLHFMYAPPAGSAAAGVSSSSSGSSSRDSVARGGGGLGLAAAMPINATQEAVDEGDDVRAFKSAFAASQVKSKGAASATGAALAALAAANAVETTAPPPVAAPVAAATSSTTSTPTWLAEALAATSTGAAAPAAAVSDDGVPTAAVTAAAPRDDRVEVRRSQVLLRPQTELEKLAGKRGVTGLSRTELEERFPFLKGAPVEGEYANHLNALNFQPVGHQVRNVRCLRCRAWGHDSGDKVCPMFNMNPRDGERQMREDPMSALLAARAHAQAPAPAEELPVVGVHELAFESGGVLRGSAGDAATAGLTLKPSALAATGMPVPAVEAVKQVRASGELGWGGADHAGLGSAGDSRAAATDEDAHRRRRRRDDGEDDDDRERRHHHHRHHHHRRDERHHSRHAGREGDDDEDRRERRHRDDDRDDGGRRERDRDDGRRRERDRYDDGRDHTDRKGRYERDSSRAGRADGGSTREVEREREERRRRE